MNPIVHSFAMLDDAAAQQDEQKPLMPYLLPPGNMLSTFLLVNGATKSSPPSLLNQYPVGYWDDSRLGRLGLNQMLVPDIACGQIEHVECRKHDIAALLEGLSSSCIFLLIS